MSIKEQIMGEAQKIAQLEGIDGLSFRVLAEKVGVKSSSVHYHFPKKEDLLFELSSLYLDSFKKELTIISNSDKNLKQRLYSLVYLFISTREAKSFCLCGMLAVFSQRLDDKSKYTTRIFFKELELWVESQVEQNQPLKSLKINAKDFGKILVSLLEGALMIDRLQETSERLVASKRWIDQSMD